ncbi:MAG: flagellar biosynthetic protein FliR [Oscillospiraceae bacterium]|nr:flagellar biosynthetic protein FliR [Oscillospiraceae bacterium]MCI8762399.1 flagellar biosynthetic protein FliR [Oscillospiraceae bacterium]MCI8808069.1 flagellar biosynthetic protein FliR [Oscillospiraceae bacterium]
MLDWPELTLFLFVTARVGGFVLFNPILGRTNIPAAFRTGMALVLSVFVTSVSDQQPAQPSGLAEFMVLMLLEIFIGFLLGMAVNFFFYIPQLAGSMIDTQMGMTMNQMYDAGSAANMSVTGQILNVLMLLLFFAGGGHLTLLRMFITSEQIVPFGQVAVGLPAYQLLLELFVECTVLSVKLCMPVLAAELIAQVGMGVLMKVIPQINVFAINIELKVIVGLALVLVLTVPFSEFLLQAELAMLNALHDVLVLTG